MLYPIELWVLPKAMHLTGRGCVLQVLFAASRLGVSARREISGREDKDVADFVGAQEKAGGEILLLHYDAVHGERFAAGWVRNGSFKCARRRRDRDGEAVRSSDFAGCADRDGERSLARKIAV